MPCERIENKRAKKAMRIIDDLNPTQIRILGALLEKEQATPEYYPLTVNAFQVRSPLCR